MSFFTEENNDEIDWCRSQIFTIVGKIYRLGKTLPRTKRDLAAVSHYDGQRS